MDESYAERAMREGPLPKADEESELVGEDNDKGLPESHDADEAAAAEEEDEERVVSVPSPSSSSSGIAAPLGIKKGRRSNEE